MQHSNLTLADIRKCFKDTFGGMITSIDLKIPEYEAAEKAYDEARAELDEQLERIYNGLEKLDRFTDPQKIENLQKNIERVAAEDVPVALKNFIHTFIELAKEYSK